ncbi:hypothetical protein [Lacticaseibacillus sp. N501-2]|uniref:DUF1659 domain-containing protein n=1 Tax=Lacticaseibacillus salsurae TaxID=3367729 RepID=UPI0038B40E89
MARSVKSTSINILLTDEQNKTKRRSYRNIDPQISDDAVLGVANLVNSFEQLTLQKPTITRVEEIELAE